jgi:hypothetical protein
MLIHRSLFPTGMEVGSAGLGAARLGSGAGRHGLQTVASSLHGGTPAREVSVS